MTFTTRFRVGSAVLVATGSLLVAAPAFAQTDPPPPAKLTELKARADEAVKDRQSQIDKLSGRLNAAGADCGQNAEVAGQLASDKSGLQALELRLGVGHRLELRLHGLELHDVLILVDFLFARPAPRSVALVDRGPEAGAEAALGLQLDAVLLGERDRERGAGDIAALDQDRAQQATGLLLLRERVRKLLGRHEALFHQ